METAKRVRQAKQKIKALQAVADYITDCENNEYDSYVTYCEENGYKPENIRGKNQRKHVYALALIGLGLKFPKD